MAAENILVIATSSTSPDKDVRNILVNNILRLTEASMDFSAAKVSSHLFSSKQLLKPSDQGS